MARLRTEHPRRDETGTKSPEKRRAGHDNTKISTATTKTVTSTTATTSSRAKATSKAVSISSSARNQLQSPQAGEGAEIQLEDDNELPELSALLDNARLSHRPRRGSNALEFENGKTYADAHEPEKDGSSESAVPRWQQRLQQVSAVEQGKQDAKSASPGEHPLYRQKEMHRMSSPAATRYRDDAQDTQVQAGNDDKEDLSLTEGMRTLRLQGNAPRGIKVAPEQSADSDTALVGRGGDDQLNNDISSSSSEEDVIPNYARQRARSTTTVRSRRKHDKKQNVAKLSSEHRTPLGRPSSSDRENHPRTLGPTSQPLRSKERKTISKYILNEADCRDDDEQDLDEDQDEHTDLSGFIVDDDAELTVYESTEVGTDDDEAQRRGRQNPAVSKNRRNDQKASVARKSENNRRQRTGRKDPSINLPSRTPSSEHGKDIEVVDLLSSPLQPPFAHSVPGNNGELGKDMHNGGTGNSKNSADNNISGSSSDNDGFGNNNNNNNNGAGSDNKGSYSDDSGSSNNNDGSRKRPAYKLLPNVRLCPPIQKSFVQSNGKERKQRPVQELPSERASPTPCTPPASPRKTILQPSSPRKLNSPSKNTNSLLFSPEKHRTNSAKGIIPVSPHRQSIDAFWSSEVINDWNEQYSPPKKAWLGSPPKNRLLWEQDAWTDDDEEEEEEEEEEGGGKKGIIPGRRDISMPSLTDKDQPSDTGRGGRSIKKKKQHGSKNEKERRKQKEDRMRFDQSKSALADSLLKELDQTISDGKLAQLTQQTGGVTVFWSRTLRTTAGQARSRKVYGVESATPVANSGNVSTGIDAVCCSYETAMSLTNTPEPMKNSQLEVPRQAQYHWKASIELAEKVIDSPERLVSTLAHEYCHLANRLVSGVYRPPHGASFKEWGRKVTSKFSQHENPLYRTITVTTRHDYAIDFRYVWLCAGPQPQMQISSTEKRKGQNTARQHLGDVNRQNVREEGEDDDDEDEARFERGCGLSYGRHSKSIDPEKQKCGKCRGVLVQVKPKPKPKPKQG